MGRLTPRPLPSDRPVWPAARRRCLIIFGLTGFAISQPLLSVLGDDPVTLAYHGVSGGQLVLLCVLIALLPPVVLCAVQAVAHRGSPRLGRAAYLVTTAGLVGCFVIQVAKELGLDQGLVIVALAVAAGCAFAVTHVRHEPVALWASYTAVLPLLAMAVFMTASPASALLSTAQDGPDRITPTSTADVPVVVVFLDEMPTRSMITEDASLDATRFPNLASFAEDATWYRHHTAMATHTVSSLPTMLTGTLPRADAPLWTNHPDSLFTLLAPTHELEVFESFTSMCPYTSCTPTRVTEDGTEEEIDVAAPGFADMLRVTRDVWTERLTPGPKAVATLDGFAEATQSVPDLSAQSEPVAPESMSLGGSAFIQSSPVRADQLIESFDADKGATLYFLHLMLPHQPFVREPDGQVYDTFDPLGRELPPDDFGHAYSWSDWTGAVSEQRHVLQAQYADRLIGRMMDELKAEGMYKDSLVVVTSDHGISFETATSPRSATEATVDALAYTPLLIKRPGQDEGAIDDTNVMGFDLVPTIADILDIPIEWEVDGAPAGSPDIDARGDTKVMYAIEGFSTIRIDRIIEYDDREEFPTVPNRWLGPLPEPDDPLSGLNALLDLDSVIGADLDAVLAGSSEHTAQIDELGLLEVPSEDGAPTGLVTGRLPDAPSGARLVLALDGVVVGGSFLSTDSVGDDRFAVLLPQAVIGDAHAVRAALVVNGEVREVAVEAGS
jgi:hypothetical protein